MIKTFYQKLKSLAQRFHRHWTGIIGTFLSSHDEENTKGDTNGNPTRPRRSDEQRRARTRKNAPFKIRTSASQKRRQRTAAQTHLAPLRAQERSQQRKKT